MDTTTRKPVSMARSSARLTCGVAPTMTWRKASPRYVDGTTRAAIWSQVGAISSGKKRPDRNTRGMNHDGQVGIRRALFLWAPFGFLVSDHDEHYGVCTFLH